MNYDSGHIARRDIIEQIREIVSLTSIQKKDLAPFHKHYQLTAHPLRGMKPVKGKKMVGSYST